jgi:hypothetical protein
MKQIEYSISTATSLHTNSISGSDEEIEPGSDLMEMSDEEFLNSMESDLNTVKEEPDDDEGVDDSVDTNTSDNSDIDDGHIDPEPVDGQEQIEEQSEAADENQADTGSESAQENQAESEINTDYMKQEFERLFGPIKANGKEIRMKDMDQVINRIQLAENYHKKCKQCVLIQRR